MMKRFSPGVRIYLPFLYGGLIAWTVRWSVRNGVDDLLIGIPTYEEWTPGHFPPVESAANALKGLRIGLAGLAFEEKVKVGAAIYADWTTSEREAEMYRREWLGK